jgi:hypothetical protein
MSTSLFSVVRHREIRVGHGAFRAAGPAAVCDRCAYLPLQPFDHAASSLCPLSSLGLLRSKSRQMLRRMAVSSSGAMSPARSSRRDAVRASAISPRRSGRSFFSPSQLVPPGRKSRNCGSPCLEAGLTNPSFIWVRLSEPKPNLALALGAFDIWRHPSLLNSQSRAQASNGAPAPSASFSSVGLRARCSLRSASMAMMFASALSEPSSPAFSDDGACSSLRTPR